MNYKQTSLTVIREEHLLYYKVDLYLNYLYFNYFTLISVFEFVQTLISVFEFVQLTAAVKLMLLQPYDRKYFLRKTRNTCIFAIVNRK